MTVKRETTHQAEFFTTDVYSGPRCNTIGVDCFATVTSVDTHPDRSLKDLAPDSATN